jgi:hypothetical protein
MRHRATILSLVAILFIAAMVLPALATWSFSAFAGVTDVWGLLIGVGLVFVLLLFVVLLTLPRFFSRR